jgi:uncharacterized membrane protein
VFEGLWLGAAVMALLVIAFLYAVIQTIRSAVMEAVVNTGPAWAATAILVLSLIGLGVAFYLAFIETRSVEAVCGPVGDCNRVQSSPYSKFLGIPVGVIGLIGYVALIVAWAVWQFGRGGLAELAPVAIFGMGLFGVLFSIYLTYVELAVIGAVCIWCLTSATLMALILLLATGPAVGALSDSAA